MKKFHEKERLCGSHEPNDCDVNICEMLSVFNCVVRSLNKININSSLLTNVGGSIRKIYQRLLVVRSSVQQARKKIVYDI